MRLLNFCGVLWLGFFLVARLPSIFQMTENLLLIPCLLLFNIFQVKLVMFSLQGVRDFQFQAYSQSIKMAVLQVTTDTHFFANQTSFSYAKVWAHWDNYSLCSSSLGCMLCTMWWGRYYTIQQFVHLYITIAAISSPISFCF